MYFHRNFWTIGANFITFYFEIRSIFLVVVPKEIVRSLVLGDLHFLLWLIEVISAVYDLHIDKI